MGTTPNRPEHANKVEAIPGADSRLTIRRRLTGYAYAANGNLHNPTPRFTWELLADGNIVDVSKRRGPLVAAAREDGAAYLAEADRRMTGR